MVKIECAYNGVDVVSPQFRISIALGRLARESMAAQVHRHESKGVSQVGAQLPTPAHAALRKAMDEHDGSALRVARFDRVQLNAAAPENRVVLQHVRPLLAGFEHRHVNAGAVRRTPTP
jgi:hypothetical protein